MAKYKLGYGINSNKPYLITPNREAIILIYCGSNGEAGTISSVYIRDTKKLKVKNLEDFSVTLLSKINPPLTSPIVKQHINLALEELANG